MTRQLRHVLAALIGAAVLLLPAVSAQAGESLGVPIIKASQGSGYTDVGEVDAGEANLTALYVDSSGAAHIAYASATEGDVDLCTIPAGGSACNSPITVLQTDGTTYSEPIQSLKYLPDGNGNAVLAVGLLGLTATHPPFNSSEDPPYTETEVFQPGGSHTAIGAVYDAGGDAGGDEIYVPDQNGIEIVGQWSDYAWPPPTVYQTANEYEFESFTSPSTDDTSPLFLGVEADQSTTLPADEVLPGEWPAGVTELANGETAVFAYDLDETAPASTNPGLAPVGMYVQPASGGSFGGLQQLGISGPVETDFAPSAYTYLINAVSSDPGGGITTNPAEDLELYAFDGTSLHWLGTVGATDNNTSGNIFPEESQWDTMPPSFEDSSGDLYMAWYASGGDDACPESSTDSDTAVADCLMYRRVGAGGVFGPRVVLSEDYADDGDQQIDDIDQIAANDSGAGWVLGWRTPGTSGSITLYAEPLSAAATVPTSPTVSGTVTAVPLTCTGSGSCSLTVAIDSSADVRGSLAHRAARSAVLAHMVLSVGGGTHRRLRLRLDRAGRALLRQDHFRLRATLKVVQAVGLTKAPDVIYTRRLTLR